METAVQIAVALALIGANALFVLTEFSVTRVRPTQVDDMESEGRPGAASVRHAVDNIDAYLAACQLGITVATIGLGVVGEPAFEHLLEPILGDAARVGGFAVSGALAFGVITVLHVVVGELSPKSLAIARTERSVRLAAPPMRVFYTVTRPFVDLFNAMGNLLLKPFGIPPAREAEHPPHTEDELRTLIGESQKKGLLAPEEREFSDRVFTFADRPVREIMIRREDVAGVACSASADEARRTVIESGHSRLPLYGDSSDEVIGFAHAIDLLRLEAEGGGDIREVRRDIARVRADAPLDEALRALRSRNEWLGLVEEGDRWVGVVSIEDLLEQIVGDIEDEFD